MRVDVNMSLYNDRYVGPRVQIKQIINTVNVERAVESEYRRQYEQLMSGKELVSETRKYNEDKDACDFIREKHTEPDYRYFLDPDLPAINITNDRISRVHKEMEDVPFETKRRFANAYGMDIGDVKVIFKNNWSVDMF